MSLMSPYLYSIGFIQAFGYYRIVLILPMFYQNVLNNFDAVIMPLWYM